MVGGRPSWLGEEYDTSGVAAATVLYRMYSAFLGCILYWRWACLEARILLPTHGVKLLNMIYRPPQTCKSRINAQVREHYGDGCVAIARLIGPFLN